MKAYSTREVAELLGLSTARVRSLMRTGVVTPQRTTAGPRDASRSKTSCCCAPPKGSSTPRCRRGASRKPCKRSRANCRRIGRSRPCACRSTATASSCATARTFGNPSRSRPCSTSPCASSARKSRRSRASPCSVRCAPRRTADDLFQAALESEEIGATAEAESAYRNAIAADPAHVAAHINLGRLRHVGKALDEAERLYRRALELEPNHPTARFNLGVVLEDRGATAQAIERVSRSRAPRPARRRRALQSRAALSANRRSAGGAAAFLAVPRPDARPHRLRPRPSMRRALAQLSTRARTSIDLLIALLPRRLQVGTVFPLD